MATAEAGIMALPCAFDEAELRWRPREGAAPCLVKVEQRPGSSVRLVFGDEEAALPNIREISRLSPIFLTLNITGAMGRLGLRFDCEADAQSIADELHRRRAEYERFDQFDPSSVHSYFQYYAKLGNQQNMLQDSVRTNTYRCAIVENPDDFRDATVMDIGAGSGILSFFAAQAGAATVYAVEASSMAEVITALAESNNFGGTSIEVVNKTVEKVGAEVPNKVDVLVSEPIGTFLFNERMIESYLCARDRFLKPGGKMFPNVGNLCIAPFSDAMLHWEQANKDGFWKNKSFYGIDLHAAVDRCKKEHFRQPIVDYINPECLVGRCHITRFDFATISVESLHKMEIPFDVEVPHPCLVHGVAGWFDAIFEGTNMTVTLSTAPWSPGTHWYQIRFLLETPLAVNAGQHIEGTLTMDANNLQSYYVKVHMRIKGTEVYSEAHGIDLKDPEYRFYTSQNAYCPPGTPGLFGQPNAHTPGEAQTQYQQTHYAQSQQVPPTAAAEVQQQWQTAAPTTSAQPQPQSQQRPAAQSQSYRGTARSRSATRRARANTAL